MHKLCGSDMELKSYEGLPCALIHMVCGGNLEELKMKKKTYLDEFGATYRSLEQ